MKTGGQPATVFDLLAHAQAYPGWCQKMGTVMQSPFRMPRDNCDNIAMHVIQNYRHVQQLPPNLQVVSPLLRLWQLHGITLGPCHGSRAGTVFMHRLRFITDFQFSVSYFDRLWRHLTMPMWHVVVFVDSGGLQHVICSNFACLTVSPPSVPEDLLKHQHPPSAHGNSVAPVPCSACRA